MIKIKQKDNKITMTRGDTLITNVMIFLEDPETKEKTAYTPVEGDSLRFVLKHPQIRSDNMGYTDAEPLIEKQISIATLELRLDPADTKPLAFGDYVYDIELTYSDNVVDTFINNAPFELVPEVD